MEVILTPERDIRMKKMFSDKIFNIYLFSIIVAAIIGFITGKIIHNLDKMAIVVEGILGAVTLYLIYLLFLSTSKPLDEINEPNVKIDFRRILRHSVMYFFIFIVVAWASQYVIDAARHITNSLMALGF